VSVWFWLDTPTACGALAADAAGVVRGGCPYFVRAYEGKHLNDVIRRMRDSGVRVRWERLA
jgi:hypothetical protein